MSDDLRLLLTQACGGYCVAIPTAIVTLNLWLMFLGFALGFLIATVTYVQVTTRR
jgi:hypothetical protein